jgi:hypothetical protein
MHHLRTGLLNTTYMCFNKYTYHTYKPFNTRKHGIVLRIIVCYLSYVVCVTCKYTPVYGELFYYLMPYVYTGGIYVVHGDATPRILHFTFLELFVYRIKKEPRSNRFRIIPSCNTI